MHEELLLEGYLVLLKRLDDVLLEWNGGKMRKTFVGESNIEERQKS